MYTIIPIGVGMIPHFQSTASHRATFLRAMLMDLHRPHISPFTNQPLVRLGACLRSVTDAVTQGPEQTSKAGGGGGLLALRPTHPPKKSWPKMWPRENQV